MRLLDRIRDTVSQQTDTPATTSINPEDAYRALSNERRRRVIEFLAESDVGDDVPVGTLADRLSDGTNRTACYVALVQNHMCVLSTDDGIGVVDYDCQAKIATVRPELFSLHRAHTAFESKLD
ncbi:DUF7344 domain-containing protein [Haloarchaeobius litoreus]|uniref:DUF7344 domain-containing protein n=1 Tax=Haloarchaeobius litoreus TaxID=755306 RepID=UPI003F5E8AAB